jgi:hypothetical protein
VFKAFRLQPGKLLAESSAKASMGDLSDKIGFREEFRREFSEVAEALRQSPLVIFVDDIDRCQSQHVLQLLEAVNFLVTCGPCYFVVAMDKRQVTRAVAEHYEVKENPDAYAQEYLEKLINIEVSLPEPTPAAYKRLLNAGENATNGSNGGNGSGWIRKAAKNLPVALVLGALAVVIALLQRIPGPSSLSETRMETPRSPAEAAETESSGPNPRGSSGPGTPLPFSPDARGSVVGLAPPPSEWTLPLLVVAPTLLLGLLLSLGLALYYQKKRRVFTDSEDFVKAVDQWHGLIFLGAKTPRAVKRFLNKLRFYAVMRRLGETGGMGGQQKLGDGELVGLASAELGVKSMLGEKNLSPENMAKLLEKIDNIFGSTTPGSTLEARKQIEAFRGRSDFKELLEAFDSLGADVRSNL